MYFTYMYAIHVDIIVSMPMPTPLPLLPPPFDRPFFYPCHSLVHGE